MYDMTFDLTNTASYNGSFVANNGGTAAGAMSALLTGLSEGRAYLNIHTNMFPSGEIRGFLVPEPASGLIALFGLGMLVLRRRSRT
jgi:MYXO-CTERM domain-containing protein